MASRNQPRRLSCAATAVAGGLLTFTPTLAPAQAQREEADFTPIVALESVAAMDMLSHPLDAGLRRALSMLPARLAELPDEIPNYAGPDGETLALLARTLLVGAPRVAVVDYGPDPQTGAPGLAGFVELRLPGENHARALHDAVQAALAQAPAAPPTRQAQDGSGMLLMDLPLGLLRVGPSQAADGAWRYLATLGAIRDEAAIFAALPQPPDAQNTVHMRGVLNLEPVLAPAMGMAQMTLGEAGAQALAPFMSLISTQYRFLAYQQRNRMVLDMRMADVREAFTALGYSETPLEASDFRSIPADATMAWIYRFDMTKWWALARSLLGFTPGFEAALAQFQAETGVNIDDDLFGALGDVAALYLSDSTGGGGALSTVLALKLRDAPRLERTLRALAEQANDRLAELPPGDGQRSYYRISQTVANDGTAYFGLRFPGLPAPLEPTSAIAGDWLVVGLSPQAAIAAVAQAQGKGKGDLGGRQRLFQRGQSQLIGYEFVDGPRALRDGYSLMTLLSSALANGVRSPDGPEREPGVILPPLPALLEGASGHLTQQTWWEGDTLVVRTETFGSLAASAAATVGSVGKLMGIWAGASAGALLPALDRARQQALVLRESAQLKQLHLGMTIYANNNNDHYPNTVRALLDQGFIAPDMLVSPIEWAGDGEGDFFLRMGGVITFEDDRIIGYSRAGYAAGDVVNVVFDDNHVQALDIDRFHEMLRMPKNRDVDWRLPRRVRQFEPNFMRKPQAPMKRAG